MAKNSTFDLEKTAFTPEELSAIAAQWGEKEEPGFFSQAVDTAGAIITGAPLVMRGAGFGLRDLVQGFDPNDTEAMADRAAYERDLAAYQKKYEGSGAVPEAFAEAAGSSGPSLVGTGASLVGMGLGTLGGPVGMAGGAFAAGGAAAARMDYAAASAQLYDEVVRRMGRKPTDAEWQGILSDMRPDLLKHAAIEGVGEGAGDVLLGAAFKPFAPLAKAAGGALGSSVAGKVVRGAGSLGAGIAGEVVTETGQQWGQGHVEADMFGGEAPTIGEAFEQVAGPTAAQTVMTGGLIGGARLGLSMLRRTTPSNSPDNPFAQGGELGTDDYQYETPLNLEQAETPLEPKNSPEVDLLGVLNKRLEAKNDAADRTMAAVYGKLAPKLDADGKVLEKGGGIDSLEDGSLVVYGARDKQGEGVDEAPLVLTSEEDKRIALDVARQLREEQSARKIAQARREAPTWIAKHGQPVSAEAFSARNNGYQVPAGELAPVDITGMAVPPSAPMMSGGNLGLQLGERAERMAAWDGAQPAPQIASMAMPQTVAQPAATGDNVSPVAPTPPVQPAPTIPNSGFGLAGVLPVQPQKVEPSLEVLPKVEPVSADNVTSAKPLSTESSTNVGLENKSKSKGESGKSLVERMEERALERKAFHYKGKKVYPKMKPLADPERESEFAAKLAEAGTKTLNAGDVVALANVYKLRDEYNERGLASDEAMKELDEILAFEYTPKTADVSKKETTGEVASPALPDSAKKFLDAIDREGMDTSRERKALSAPVKSGLMSIGEQIEAEFDEDVRVDIDSDSPSGHSLFDHKTGEKTMVLPVDTVSYAMHLEDARNKKAREAKEEARKKDEVEAQKKNQPLSDGYLSPENWVDMSPEKAKREKEARQQAYLEVRNDVDSEEFKTNVREVATMSARGTKVRVAFMDDVHGDAYPVESRWILEDPKRMGNYLVQNHGGTLNKGHTMEYLKRVFEAAGVDFPEVHIAMPDKWKKPAARQLPAFHEVAYSDGTKGGMNGKMFVFQTFPAEYGTKNERSFIHPGEYTGDKAPYAFIHKLGARHEFPEGDYPSELVPLGLLPASGKDSEHVVMAHSDGTLVELPIEDVAYFQAQAKGKAKFFAQEGKRDRPVMVKVDGEPMGVTMPMKPSSLLATDADYTRATAMKADDQLTLTNEEYDAVERPVDILEPDSEGRPAENRVGEESLSDDGRGNGETGRAGARGAGEGVSDSGGESVSRPAASSSGERRDTELAAQDPSERDELGGVPGSSGRGRSGGDGNDGLVSGRREPAETSQPAAEGSGQVRKEEPKGLREVRKALPKLFEGQQEDVYFAEQRWKRGLGVLFTNGTGTGKTGLGLGAIKRLVDAGRNNILVAVPADKIGSDWVTLGQVLGVDVTKLEDTKDKGRGVTITTHANMAQNNAIFNREWDLVVIDECHKLIASKDGTKTNLLEALRGLTYHPAGAFVRAQKIGKGPELWDEYKKAYEDLGLVQKDSDSTDAAIAAAEARAEKASKAWHAHLEKVEEDAAKPRPGNRANLEYKGDAGKPGVMLLSATPFAYEKSVEYADGYLFDFDRTERGGYNDPSGFEKFMVEHFGYRMRYNKLTEPEAGVDRGLLQRQFNSWLKKLGALSSRQLDTPFDYDRKFILTENAIGQKIDEGFGWLWEHHSDYPVLEEHLRKRFNFLRRQYLLETIKANEAVPLIRENVELGRKVVVFYQYNKPIDMEQSLNPFDVSDIIRGEEASGDTELVDEARKFAKERPDLQRLDLNSLRPSLETLKTAFPNAVVFAGTESKKAREEGVKKFQADDSGVDVILVQADAGEAGISLHDKTGKHQRILFNLGLPVKPVTSIQQEGRIFRAGQQSNAMFRYLNTGTTWERTAFAQTVANRASAAENLALGEEARGLKDAFINAFEESGPANFGDSSEGTGGKQADRELRELLSDFDRAKALYWSNQKKTAKNKAKEGKDYFPTPEPLGQKMVEWAGLSEGDRMLEPSAGHGAIARWAPEGVDLTVIEPSEELHSRLLLAVDARRAEKGTFEDHALMNKYNAIVMNPPFGTGGKLAVEHLAKAFRHLAGGGRIVAIIPEGPSANKHFDRWMATFDDVKPGVARPVLVREVSLPSVTFERAGTSVKARVVILDSVTGDAIMGGRVAQMSRVELDSAKTVDELFGRLENMEAPARPGKAGSRPVSPTSTGAQSAAKPRFKLAETEHAIKKIPMYVATFAKHEERVVFDKARSVAKEHDGWYSKFDKNGAIPGFQFTTEQDRADFVREMEEFMGDDDGGAYASLRPSFASNSPYAALRLTPETRDRMNRVVGEVKANAIRGKDAAAAIAQARAWAKANINNPIIKTVERGKVVFDEGGIKDSLSHKPLYQNKLDSVSVIKHVLEDGAYLGSFDDLGGNDIANHYWAGRARFADGDHLVFVRVREAKGREQRFYVHDVFSDELIKKATPLTREEMVLLDQAGSIGNKTGRPGRSVEGVTLDSQRSTLPRGVVLEARILRTIMEVNGQSRKSVQEVVDKLNASAAGAAPVNVVQSFDELPENLKQNFKGREGDLEGVYDEGTVWLVADNLASPERVAEVWMHEQVGHGGFEALMPEKEKTQLLNRLFGMMGGKNNAALRAIAEEYGLDLDKRAGQHRALREYLADLAEKEGLSGQEMTRWQRAWKHIADTLKKLVYRLTGKHAKIAEMEVRDLLTAMKARVRDGGPDGPKGGTYASFISDAAKSAADKVAKAMKKPEGFSDDFMESYKNLSAQAKRDLSVWNRFVSQPYALAKKFPLIRSLMDIQSEREDKRREAYTSSMAGVDTFQKMKESDPTAYKYARDLIIALDSETGDKLKTQLDEDMFLFDEDGKRTGFNPKYYAQLRDLVMRARNRKTHSDEAAFGRAVDAYMGVRRSLDRDLASILARMEELGFKSREAYLAEFEKRKAELEADETLTKKQRQDALDAISMANKREQEKLDTLRKSMGRRPFYFPRMRFGDYFARFVDADGKTLYRVHYDASTQTQAAYEAAKIKATMKAELKKMGVDLADVKFENGKIEGIPQEVFADALSTVDTQAILERALGRLQEKGEVTGEELTNLREALFDQVSEVLKSSGFGQHMMRRGNSNIAGYETEDVFKSLSAYKAGLHGWLTKMEASYAFASTLSEAAEDGAARKSPKMYGYAKQYVRDMLRNSDAIDRTNSRIRAGLFLWFLGGNIKSALVNATQNFSLGVPVLGAEIGFGKAYGKILSGSRDAVVDWASKREAGQESKKLTKDEAAFLDDFQKHGEALARKTMELTGMQDRSWTSTWYGKLAEWAGKPIEYAEKFNRMSLALAAYRAAKAGDVKNESTLAEYGEEKGKPWSEASARKFAREVVNEAHFVYGKANQPAPVRGFARGLGFGYTFRTYAQSLGSWYYHMLAGEKGNVGRIAAAQAALHATMLGGVAAIPLYGTMRTVLTQLFGGEPPEEVLGYDQIDILMYGLPSLGGVYLGGSMELDLPAIAGAKQGDEGWIEQLHDNVFLAVTGPLGGALDRLGRATYFADTGQTGRVLEELAPTAVTNVLKAHRLATTGARTKSGKPIPALGDKSGKPAQLSGAEVVSQALGFQPVSRAKGWQAYQTKQEKTAYKSDFQSDLVTRYVMAKANKDWKEVDKLVAEWRGWNKEHPDQKIKPLAQLAKRRERPVK